MKIDNLNGLMAPLTPDKGAKGPNAGDLDFQKVLMDAQANRAGETDLSTATAMEKAERLLEGPQSLYPFQTIAEFGKDVRGREEGIQTADQVLGVLEKYQKAMADPNISLKDLYPYIQSLSREVKDISQVTDHLPASDPLKKILGEVGVLATVEIERFNRGDYVS